MNHRTPSSSPLSLDTPPRCSRLLAGACLATAIATAAPAARASDTLERVTNWAGQQVLGSGARHPDLTPDGRYAVYSSSDWNLFNGVTLNQQNIIFRDLQTGTSELISLSKWGGEASAGSSQPALSADGRFVVFTSSAWDIVTGSPSGSHIYMHDRQTGVIELVDVPTAGGSANGSASEPSLSDDGRYVAFESYATNLAGADTNGKLDVFVRDRQLGVTTQLTQGNLESEEPTISADGQRVVFHTRANDMLAADTNGKHDVVLWHRSSDSYELVSRTSLGGVSNGTSWISTISRDGRWVAFCSDAGNLNGAGASNGKLQVIVFDSVTGLMTTASVDAMGNGADHHGYDPRLSSDGRFVTFQTRASNLIATDTNGNEDIYVHDMLSAETRRVSESLAGVGGLSPVFPVAPISTDGTRMLFADPSNNLVVNDTNGNDLFVRSMSWPGAWSDLGQGLAGTNGVPVLTATGDLTGGSLATLTLSAALPLGSTALVLGFSQLDASFRGGTLVPFPDIIVIGLPIDAAGTQVIVDTWPAGVPSGAEIFVQHWFADPGAVHGLAASNGLFGTTP
ncbi:MAG: hypothetical protein DRQ55_12700 [Planctomycetota bacterium]|nr:MAG: hypothetical protein DRQ55_12700 [Planctomycetota bacterium]